MMNQPRHCPQCGQLMHLVGRFLVCPEHGIQAEQTPAPEDSPLIALARELPHPLALVIGEYVREENHFLRLHRLTDAAELLTRFLSITLLADLLRQGGQFPDAIRKALTEKIERPTFGAWKDLLRLACAHLPKTGGQLRCFVAELPAYIQQRLLPTLGNGDGVPAREVIALRNLLAHQGRLGEEQARELCEAHRASFEVLLSELSFLRGYLLLGCTADRQVRLLRGFPRADGAFPLAEGLPRLRSLEPGRVLLLHGREEIDLFPLQAFNEIFQWREEHLERVSDAVPQVYFRMNSSGYLEFTPMSDRAAFSHERGAALERFRELFRLEEWRHLTAAQAEGRDLAFEGQIAELTELFVGREEHLRSVKECLKTSAGGVLWISGQPGIGKSAFIARLVKDYQNAPRRYLVIPYFFRIGHPDCALDQFLRAALLHLHTAMGEVLDLQPTSEERRRQFCETLGKASRRLGRKILFGIDGLDEIYRIDPSFISLLFVEKAPNIIWLCAGGIEESELGKILQQSGARSVFPDGLPPLDEHGVHAMLGAHLERLKYRLFTRDEQKEGQWHNRFVEVLSRKSEGLPLYVKLVIADLRQGKWTLADEDRLPDSLRAYFEDILARLRVSDVGAVLTPLFCLLALARAPVTAGALKSLLGSHFLSQSPRWESLFRRSLEDGHLMLRRAQTEEHEPGWSFYHDSFRQHLRESATVQETREWARQAWLDRCRHWQSIADEDLRRYVLRHAAWHFREARLWGELYALARHEVFLQTQASSFPESPELALNTLQAALLGAGDANDAGAMAEFLLRRAQRLKEIMQESPLAALRQGNLKRASELAELEDVEQTVLWYLLLIWELQDTQRTVDARRTFERLLAKEFRPQFVNWQKQALVSLLARVHQTAAGEFLHISEQFLETDHDWYGLSRHLKEQSEYSLAFSAAAKIKSRKGQAGALTDIAIAEARSGQIAAALETVQRIELREFGSKEDRVETGKVDALLEIARARARVGETSEAEALFSQAVRIATEMRDKDWCVRALCRVAPAQGQSGDKGPAQATLDLAVQTALAIAAPDPRMEAFSFIALSSAQVDHRPVTEFAIARALESPSRPRSPWAEAHARVLIAEAQAVSKDFPSALVTAASIERSRERALALRSIARAQVMAGEEESGLTTFAAATRAAQSIMDSEGQASVSHSIAVALAEAGRFSKALETSLQIENQHDRDSALADLAVSRAQAHEFEAAQATAALIEGKLPRGEALKAIAVNESRAGNEAAAREMFSRAVQQVREEGTAMVDVAEAQAMTGDARAARDTLGELLAAAISHSSAQQYAVAKEEVEALREIALAQIRSGVPADEGVSVLAPLRKATSIKDPYWQTLALAAIAKAHALVLQARARRLGKQPPRPRALFELALKKAGEIKAESRLFDALRYLAVTEAYAGQREAARATISSLLDEALKKPVGRGRDWLLNQIVEAQILMRDFLPAKETAQGIEDQYTRQANLEAIIKAEAQASSSRSGGAALQQAQEIRNRQRRAKALSEVAVDQALAKNDEVARSAAEAALRDAEALAESNRERDKVLTNVAIAQARTGLGARAVELALSNLGGRKNRLPEVALALAKANDRENVKRLLSAAVDDESAYRLAGLLAIVYPEQVKAIAAAISGEEPDAI